MDRFFRGNPPQAGKPISMRGIASGIMALANAVSNMRIIGGHIEWSPFLVPTIVVDPAAISGLIDSGLPNGTEIPGRVIYDTSTDPPRLAQYTLTWNAGTKEFDESATATTIHSLTSHNAAHGVDDPE